MLSRFFSLVEIVICGCFYGMVVIFMFISVCLGSVSVLVWVS